MISDSELKQTHLVSNLHVAKVLGNLTVGVSLNNQVKVTLLVVSDRSVLKSHKISKLAGNKIAAYRTNSWLVLADVSLSQNKGSNLQNNEPLKYKAA